MVCYGGLFPTIKWVLLGVVVIFVLLGVVIYYQYQQAKAEQTPQVSTPTYYYEGKCVEDFNDGVSVAWASINGTC